MTAFGDIRPGFVGAGRMARALVRGFAVDFGNGPVIPRFVEPDVGAARQFLDVEPRAIPCADLRELCHECNVLLLAVKPQTMPEVLTRISPWISPEHLVISVAAGVRIPTLQRALAAARIVRVMPNTPCLVQQGVSAVAWGKTVRPEDRKMVTVLLQSMGGVVEVAETQLDAVTGVSGSGPAWVFSFVEALIDGGEAVGLERDDARELVLRTIKGSIALIEQTGKSPAELRSEVASPGGTTLAGLSALEEFRFREALMETIRRATRRARELGQ